MDYDVECPYCNHSFDVCEDDGSHCNQDAFEDEQCPECGKIMTDDLDKRKEND